MRTLLVLFVVIMTSCKNEPRPSTLHSKTDETFKYVAEPLEVYDFEGLKPFLETDTDKIYIVNFWATWCAPCIKELPYFEAVKAAYADKNVEVLLVSLDFPKKYDSHLKPFIKKHELKSKVVALNDMDSNTWIPAINPDWSGAIPATLIFNKDKRQFYEQTFTYEELETELKQFLK
ncbi:MAG: TlpA family protein disulfide reductase [Gelidibacter sp.]